MTAVHVQLREDAELGAAFRRAEDLCRKWGQGHTLSLITSDDPPGYIVDATGTVAVYGRTPSDALTAFADALEAELRR